MDVSTNEVPYNIGPRAIHFMLCKIFPKSGDLLAMFETKR